MEERRRLWWGVFILDRVICLGNRKNFCLPGPPEGGLLPVDDVAWVSQMLWLLGSGHDWMNRMRAMFHKPNHAKSRRSLTQIVHHSHNSVKRLCWLSPPLGLRGLLRWNVLLSPVVLLLLTRCAHLFLLSTKKALKMGSLIFPGLDLEPFLDLLFTSFLISSHAPRN